MKTTAHYSEKIGVKNTALEPANNARLFGGETELSLIA